MKAGGQRVGSRESADLQSHESCQFNLSDLTTTEQLIRYRDGFSRIAWMRDGEKALNARPGLARR